MAEARGISFLSITDHDTVEAYANLAVEKPARNIGIITGTEISTAFMGREVHLLAYGIDVSHQELGATLKSIREGRTERARLIISKLNSLGFHLDFEKISESAVNRNLARPHIARAMVSAGYVASIKEAFDKYIGDGCVAEVRKRLPDIASVMEIVKRAGGIAVLAHPGKNWNHSLIAKLKESGLEGLEVHHPSHDQSTADFYIRIAADEGMFITGGSDFHGSKENDYENMGRISLRDKYPIDRLIERTGLFEY